MGVAGIPDAVVVGVGLVLVGYGGAVILSIGHAVAVSGDLDREGKGVSGAGGIGDAQMCRYVPIRVRVRVISGVVVSIS